MQRENNRVRSSFFTDFRHNVKNEDLTPILSNIYLHIVLDEWFQELVKPRLKGRAIMCRYADDWVCTFQYRDDARRFYNVLPKRLGRYELQVEPSKTKIVRFSRFHPNRKRGKTFTFLGFEFYWFKDRKGIIRAMRRTSPMKQRLALQRMIAWLKASSICRRSSSSRP